VIGSGLFAAPGLSRPPPNLMQALGGARGSLIASGAPPRYTDRCRGH